MRMLYLLTISLYACIGLAETPAMTKSLEREHELKRRGQEVAELTLKECTTLPQSGLPNRFTKGKDLIEARINSLCEMSREASANSKLMDDEKNIYNLKFVQTENDLHIAQLECFEKSYSQRPELFANNLNGIDVAQSAFYHLVAKIHPSPIPSRKYVSGIRACVDHLKDVCSIKSTSATSQARQMCALQIEQESVGSVMQQIEGGYNPDIPSKNRFFDQQIPGAMKRYKALQAEITNLIKQQTPPPILEKDEAKVHPVTK